MLFVPAQLPHALHVPIIGPIYFVLPEADHGRGEDTGHLTGLLPAEHLIPLPIVLDCLTNWNAVCGTASNQNDKQEEGQNLFHGPIITHGNEKSIGAFKT